MCVLYFAQLFNYLYLSILDCGIKLHYR